MVTDTQLAPQTRGEQPSSSAKPDELGAGLDSLDESIAQLQSLDGVGASVVDLAPPADDVGYRFRPSGVVRLTQAARPAYQDDRISVERLLDAEGFLTALSPLQQRRKVWEAWKHLHGLDFVQRSQATPHGLEPDAASLIALADHIPKRHTSSHRDLRAQGFDQGFFQGK